MISDQVHGNVRGNFQKMPAYKFLELLSDSYGLSWYYDGKMAYFTRRSEDKSALINLGVLTAEQLKGMLTSLGVYSSRYPWRAWEEGRIIFLTGPPRYVELVSGLVKEFGLAASQEKSLKLFKLKHAWAEDYTVSLMDQKMVLPGVASLLQDIVTGRTEAVDDGAENIPEAVQKLKGLSPQGPTILDSNGVPRGAGAPVRTSGVLDTGLGSQSNNQQPRILADPRLNAVLVWDIRERMKYYKEIIKALDVPAKLVEIRAIILDVSTDYLSELGISWNFQGTPKNDQVTAVGGANVGVGDAAVDFLSNAGSGLNLSTIYTSGLSQIMARVHALETDGNAKVLSRPTVLTLDNIQAQMQTSQTFYVRVAGTYDSNLFKVTAGTVLQVTPHAIEDEAHPRIKLIINIQDGTPDDTNQVDEIPTVNQSVINTQAVVNQGQSLVIGGHYYEETSDGVEGVPYLNKVPVLGRLFETKTKKIRRMERIFIISPTFVEYDQTGSPKIGRPELAQEMDKEATVESKKTVDNVLANPPSRGGCSRQVGPDLDQVR